MNCFVSKVTHRGKLTLKRSYTILERQTTYARSEIWHGEPCVGDFERGGEFPQDRRRQHRFPRVELAQGALAQPTVGVDDVGELRELDPPQLHRGPEPAPQFFLF
jgi:hypothetical protein